MNTQINPASNTNRSYRLDGKVALVTGGSRGIGAAIAKRLAAEGAKVAITYSTNSAAAQTVIDEIRQNGGTGLAIQADSASVKDIKNAVSTTVAELGGLHILVNNAGIIGLGNVADFDVEEFDRVMAVNVKGVFVATQEALKHLKEGGRIINIGSINSDIVPFPGMAIYSMSKGAISTFTRGLARDIGPRGITANNIQPGPVDTDLNPDSGEFAEAIKNIMALPRYGKTEEIANLAAFLASDEAAYVTGASWNIDGGFGL